MGKWTDLPKKPKNSKISTPPYQAKEGEGGGVHTTLVLFGHILNLL